MILECRETVHSVPTKHSSCHVTSFHIFQLYVFKYILRGGCESSHLEYRIFSQNLVKPVILRP